MCRVEHNKRTSIGTVLQGWTDQRGAMFALAEIDTTHLHGAVTAQAVENGKLAQFSLGYVAQMKRKSDGKIEVGDKNIVELSIVKVGALTGCNIGATERHSKRARV